MKGISKIKDGFSIKYFLMCLKNHTLSSKDFCAEDFKEIEEDRKKLNPNYYLFRKEKKLKRRNTRKQSLSNTLMNLSQLRKIQEHSLTKKITRNSGKNMTNDINQINRNFSKKKTQPNINIPKRFIVLNTTEEFFENLDFISSKVYNLIVESNNKYYRNVYLKLELENVIKNSPDKIKYSKNLENQISLYAKNLNDLKAKNKLLLSNLNNLKEHQFQHDVKFILVLRYIHKIYNNIKKEDNKIIDITKEMVISYGERYYLNIIEKFFIKLLIKVNDIKKRIPEQYKNYKFKLERKKKKNAFYTFQRLLAEKLQIKIDKVLQKADKIAYKPYRKTNDYKKDHKKHKIKKKEIKKTNLELFAEYLDEDNY